MIGVLRSLIPIVVFFALAFSAQVTAGPLIPQPGEHYKLVQTDVSPKDGEILVQAFFWYGCPHCYHLEAYLEPWKERKAEDVRFEPLALALNQNWMPLTMAFYAADALDGVEQTHVAMFKAIHENNFRPQSAEDLADFYAEQGVDRDAFLREFTSFGTENAARRTGRIAEQAGVRGVPAILVNGKYLITAETAGGHREMIEIVEALAQQIRAEYE